MKIKSHTHEFKVFINAKLSLFADNGVAFSLATYDDAQYDKENILIKETTVSVPLPTIDLTADTIAAKEEKLETLEKVYLTKREVIKEEIESLRAIEYKPEESMQDFPDEPYGEAPQVDSPF